MTTSQTRRAGLMSMLDAGVILFVDDKPNDEVKQLIADKAAHVNPATRRLVAGPEPVKPVEPENLPVPDTNFVLEALEQARGPLDFSKLITTTKLYPADRVRVALEWLIDTGAVRHERLGQREFWHLTRPPKWWGQDTQPDPPRPAPVAQPKHLTVPSNIDDF